MRDGPLVLIVDDEPDVVLLCRVNLELAGFAVLEAWDGEAALASVRAHRPDVVLLDVVMRPVDGWQVLRTLQDDPDLEHVPVVVMTARVDVADQIAAWSLGAADYVTKPFSVASLTTTVAKVATESPADRQARRSRALRRLRDRPRG